MFKKGIWEALLSGEWCKSLTANDALFISGLKDTSDEKSGFVSQHPVAQPDNYTSLGKDFSEVRKGHWLLVGI